MGSSIAGGRPVIGHLMDYLPGGVHYVSDQCTPTSSDLGSGADWWG